MKNLNRKGHCSTLFGRCVHGEGRGFLEVGLEFGRGGSGGVDGAMSQGVGAVNTLDGWVSALMAPFAKGVEAIVGRGGVCKSTDSPDVVKGTPLFAGVKGLEVETLGVGVGSEIVVVTTNRVEDGEIGDREWLDHPVSWNCKYHRVVGLV